MGTEHGDTMGSAGVRSAGRVRSADCARVVVSFRRRSDGVTGIG